MKMKRVDAPWGLELRAYQWLDDARKHLNMADRPEIVWLVPASEADEVALDMEPTVVACVESADPTKIYARLDQLDGAEDKYLREVISHECAHCFQVGPLLDDLHWIQDADPSVLNEAVEFSADRFGASRAAYAPVPDGGWVAWLRLTMLAMVERARNARDAVRAKFGHRDEEIIAELPPEIREAARRHLAAERELRAVAQGLGFKSRSQAVKAMQQGKITNADFVRFRAKKRLGFLPGRRAR